MSKKYSKHMKSLRDRGNPKKGGAGGKHTWGAPGCELDEEYIDSKDPNYDSEDENDVMVCVENNDKSGSKINSNNIKSINSIEDDDDNKDEEDDDDHSNFENLKELNPENLDSEIKLIVLEYFHNGDTIEVIDHLKCYNLFKIKAHLIAYLIQIALEHNNTCKELMSRLLRDLTEEIFVEKDFIRGFDMLMRNLSDLTLDNPDAPEVINIIFQKILKIIY
jgi:programmed cell death protein 4